MSNAEEPKDSSAAPATSYESVDCPDCNIKGDLILKSSDGILFAAHRDNVHLYSEKFPGGPPITSPTDLISVIDVVESGDVVQLLLQSMHLRPQPAIYKLPFKVLSELAHAAEKYLVYSIMPVCMMSMQSHAHQFPLDVLEYAIKHGYVDLANEAARFTLEYSLKDVRLKFGKGSTTPYHWAEYKEQWTTIMHLVHTKKPYAAMMHKGGRPECDLWQPFYDDILINVKLNLSLENFETIVLENLPDCLQCCHRARRWVRTVNVEVQELQPFSHFM